MGNIKTITEVGNQHKVVMLFVFNATLQNALTYIIQCTFSRLSRKRSAQFFCCSKTNVLFILKACVLLETCFTSRKVRSILTCALPWKISKSPLYACWSCGCLSHVTIQWLGLIHFSATVFVYKMSNRHFYRVMRTMANEALTNPCFQSPT